MKSLFKIFILVVVLTTSVNLSAMELSIDYGKPKANAEIVGFEYAKQNSGIDFEEEDNLLRVMLSGVNRAIENYIGAPILEREKVVIHTRNFQNTIPFKFQVNEITKLSVIDTENATTEISEDEYDFFMNELNIEIDKPADFKALKIECSAGYTNADMPEDIKDAALLMFSKRETYREDTPSKLDTVSKDLLRSYKIY